MAFQRPFVLGIDPGLNGGLALYDTINKTLHHVESIPIVTLPNGKRTLDIYTLGITLGGFARYISFALIEQVHSMPGQGVVSTFTFGKGFGCILGALGVFLVPIKLIPPSVWKTALGLSSNKKQSIQLAARLFPDFKSEFSKTKDDGKAEAALIAYIGGCSGR